MRRRFIDLPQGQLHAWDSAQSAGGVADAVPAFANHHSGAHLPLLMLHAAPGSARMLLPLAELLGRRRRVIAIDLPGMGDSAAMPVAIDSYASILWAALDSLGIGSCSIYGTLAGARVAVEMARQNASRARALILDGVGVAGAEQTAELAQRYIPEFRVDWMGTQFHEVWHLVRDQYLFFPWYARDAAHRRAMDMPAPELLHIKALEVLKALNRAGALLRVALDYPLLERLAAIEAPVLASGDLLAHYPRARPLQAIGGEPLTANIANLNARCAEFDAFLASEGR